MKIIFRAIFLLIALTKIYASDDEDILKSNKKNNSALSNQEVPAHTPPTILQNEDKESRTVISAALIYQTVRMDNLNYISGGINESFSPYFSESAVHCPNWSWDPGFKIGIGYNLPHDSWEIFGEYSWLHSYASDSVKGTFFTPIWNIANLSNQNIHGANSSWGVDFNSLDLSLARTYKITPCLSLCPTVGLKGSLINQRYNVHYNIVDLPALESKIKMKNNQKFQGLGLRAGFRSTWSFNKYWGLYGSSYVSALCSKFNLYRKDQRNDLSNSGGKTNPQINTDVAIVHLSNQFNNLTAILELGIGIEGKWMLNNERCYFSLKGGWEEQVWFNFNQLISQENDPKNSGHLTLEGLVVKARLSF